MLISWRVRGQIGKALRNSRRVWRYEGRCIITFIVYIYIYTYVICVYVYFRFLFLETYCVCNKNICTLHLYCKRMYIYVYTHTLYWHIVQGTMFGFCMFLGWIDTLVLEIVYKQPSRCRSSLGASTLSVLKMTFISTVDGLLVERNVLVTGSSF